MPNQIVRKSREIRQRQRDLDEIRLKYWAGAEADALSREYGYSVKSILKIVARDATEESRRR